MVPEECPNCGAEVPRNAKACPECGSDESTGWSDRAHAENLGIPDDNFDHDKFVDEEFGGQKSKRSGLKVFGGIAVTIIVILLILFFAGLLRF
jgi:uncharacterized membrane protein YvbJ